jgi:nitroimidazol reductase NimA-like FMN-containing flavoprotein (pyridoxamine 5'-phosphate oxidase superfamily)
MEPDDAPTQPVLANPWLAGPAPAERLPRPELEERILNLLSTQNMCVLATTGEDGPLATPVRYDHLDFIVVFTAQAGSPKLRNIARDPRVSVGVFAPLVGQASSRGAQLFGTARVLHAGDEGFDRLVQVYRWQSDAVERGRALDEEHAPKGPLVAIDVDRVVYTEHWLRRLGYAPRQHWTQVGP